MKTFDNFAFFVKIEKLVLIQKLSPLGKSPVVHGKSALVFLFGGRGGGGGL